MVSTDANKEDPIDSAILKTCQDEFGNDYEAKMGAYRRTKFAGFNPTTKRSIAYCEHHQRRSLKNAKSLTRKVLCTGDDGGDCWTVENLDTIRQGGEERRSSGRDHQEHERRPDAVLALEFSLIFRPFFSPLRP